MAVGPPHTTPLTPSGFPNDDEPLYDSVASEDDYGSMDRLGESGNQLNLLDRQTSHYNSLQKNCLPVVSTFPLFTS